MDSDTHGTYRYKQCKQLDFVVFLPRLVLKNVFRFDCNPVAITYVIFFMSFCCVVIH